MADDKTVHPHDAAYAAWRKDPNPGNLRQVVNSLSPVIDYAVSSYGGGDHKIVGAHARAMTAEAVKSYDPKSGAALGTWVTGQLQGLSRVRRNVGSPLGVPERAQLDAFAIHRGMQELTDKHGYEPDMLTLADHIGMPVKRIETVRRLTRAEAPEEAGLYEAEAQPADWSREAIEYVMHDLEPLDRKIAEHRTGYGGTKVLAPKDLAAKLKLTPVALSRRSMKIAARVAEMEDAIGNVYSGGEVTRHA